jgi:hypothetical protein
MPGEEPVEEGGAGASHMQVSGGGGSKANAWLFSGVRREGWISRHSFVTNLDVTAHPNYRQPSGDPFAKVPLVLIITIVLGTNVCHDGAVSFPVRGLRGKGFAAS